MRALLLVLFLMMDSAAYAACVATGRDGELADESCAESQLQLSVPALARVSLLDAFTLGEFDFETPPQTSDDFCIWYNSETFSMTVSSANSSGGGQFVMLGSNTTEQIPYEVTWFDRTGNSGSELNLSNLENIPQNQLSLPEQPVSSDCSVDNVSIQILVPLDNLQGKPEDSYSDTLTVTVAVQ